MEIYKSTLTSTTRHKRRSDYREPAYSDIIEFKSPCCVIPSNSNLIQSRRLQVVTLAQPRHSAVVAHLSKAATAADGSKSAAHDNSVNSSISINTIQIDRGKNRVVTRRNHDGGRSQKWDVTRFESVQRSNLMLRYYFAFFPCHCSLCVDID